MKLKAIGNLKAGEVVYMRPDHPHYKPGHFAVCMYTDTVETQSVARVLYVSSEAVRRELFMGEECARAVEVTSIKQAAGVEGMTIREIESACRWLRDGAEFPVAHLDGSFLERCVNARRGADLNVGARTSNFVAPAAKNEEPIDPVQEHFGIPSGRVSAGPPMIDPGPIASDGPELSPFDPNGSGPFGDP